MPVIAFDTETWLIEPGLRAPPLVCVQWKRLGEASSMLHRERALATVEAWLDGDAVLVGHNVAYDMGVLASQWPHLLPKIFAKYDRDQVTDTQLRDQLLNIARGTFRFVMNEAGELLPVKYNLDACIRRHFGRQLQKDGWRLFYRVFDQCPYVAMWVNVAARFQSDCAGGDWPDWTAGIAEKDRKAMLLSDRSEPERYALADADETLALYEAQERIAEASVSTRPGLLDDQFRKARASFALHLSSCWGLYTDPDAVDKLEADLQAEFDELQRELQQAGLIREDGTGNVAAAREAMVAACAEEGLPVACTKGGAVSLADEACSRFDEDTIIGRYSKFLGIRKTLSNDVKMLRSGCEVPIQPSYGWADTGRTTCREPNIQAINRGAGIREAFRPRPGQAFISADFSGLELHTLAAWCLETIGWSRLAETLNAGQDAHLAMAAEMMSISYEEASARLAAGDKEVKKFRQRAKAINFGRPGGLGDKKFVRYAKSSYGVDITLAEAAQSKVSWLQRFPEMTEHFRLASVATNNLAKLADEQHVFTRRWRGNVRYSSLCNGRFQGLGADAATEALWRVTRACYVERSSALYGCRVVAFVHDEIICECPVDRVHEGAIELGRIMREGANMYLSKVPVRLEPLAMGVWSKGAEAVYENGRLIPWTPEWAAARDAAKKLAESGAST